MNSLKPLITIAVLGCIGYVVYTHINSKPSAPPPGAPSGWDSAPTVQMPGENSASGKWGGLGGSQNNPLPPVAINSSAGGPAGANSANTVAPSFSPQTPALGSQGDTTAPTFAASGASAKSNDAPGAVVTPPAEDKWGTTDPNAAVTKLIPPATANYGDGPAADPSIPNNDRYPSASADGQAPPEGLANPSLGADQQDVGKQFEAAWEKCNKMLEDGKLAEGLTELSYWHEHPRLSANENKQLTDLLDQVAGTVIYSTQHFTEPAHVVKDGERLEDIAGQYGVPWQLLAKINGIEDPASLQPGEQLKVVRGPFSVVFQVEKRQLTLMLGNMYAGRFVIGLGRDMPPREGTFAVTEKVSNPVYHGRDRTIDADDPNNPLGERWIALGSEMGIHGVGPLTDLGSTNQPGSISLGQRDIDDLYDILSVGSKVMIVR